MSSHIVVFSGKLDITLWALIHLYGSKAGCKIKRFRSNLSFIHLFIHSLYICLLCRISSFHDGTSTWKDVPKVCLSTMWSVLLKNSLLEQHKRLLGHRDIFSCDSCHKTFFREDNLTAHKIRHDRSDFHQCDVCNHVFSHPETLDLHKRNRHDQIGKGIKRKTTTIDGPLIKRRTTTYDDLEDSFSISIIGEQKMPKFNMTSTKYKVTFQDLDIRGIPNT